MFKNLFRGNKYETPKTIGPIEPIFPGENFSVGQLETEDGVLFVTVNQAYANYPNKKYFPWCAILLIEFEDKNENGHPTYTETKVLYELEDKIADFFKKKHIVHFIGRITQRDYRELFYYIDQPGFDQKEVKDFFDEINCVRGTNFNLNRDPEWKNVSGLIN